MIGVSCGGSGSALGDESSPAAAPCEGMRVRRLSGRVLDIHNQPTRSRFFSVCGNLCVKGELANDGSFLYDKQFCFLGARPAFFFHGGDNESDLSLDFTHEGAADVDVRLEKTLYVLPVSEMRKLTLDPRIDQSLADGAGFELKFAARTVEPGLAAWIAVGAVPRDKYPPIADVETLTALYALRPAEPVFAAPASVTFPNSQNLPPGTAVDILAIGTTAWALGPHPGALGRAAGGRVTGDGAAVVSNPGEGLMGVAWVGYRPTQ